VTTPINPHVHTHPQHIAADTAPADAQRTARDGAGSVDADDGGQSGGSAAVSVDVRSAVGAENQAAAASAPEHVDAAAQLVAALSDQVTADPAGARAAHGDVNRRAALSLLS
jgi:hypothetical protein